MSTLVADCPRCKASKITFDVRDEIHIGIRYDWQKLYEAFCICRACRTSTVFVLSQIEARYKDVLDTNSLSSLQVAVNQFMKVEGPISIKDFGSEPPPQYLPENIEAAFKEGSACLAIGCYNAAATMFRLCVDLATKPILPERNENGLNSSIRRSLGLRLKWLFDNGELPEALKELSICIKDDGNDGAHQGTLGEEDAADIFDFTYVLLERLFTEPERINLAKERRAKRRSETRTPATNN